MDDINQEFEKAVQDLRDGLKDAPYNGTDVPCSFPLGTCLTQGDNPVRQRAALTVLHLWIATGKDLKGLNLEPYFRGESKIPFLDTATEVLPPVNA